MYYFSALSDLMQTRGLDATILRSIFKGDLGKFSPALRLLYMFSAFSNASAAANADAAGGGGTGTVLEKDHTSPAIHAVKDSSPSSFFKDFVPVALFHGSNDHSCPPSVCIELAGILCKGGGRVHTRLYEGLSHTGGGGGHPRFISQL